MSMPFGEPPPIVELPEEARANAAAAIQFLVERLADTGALPHADVPAVVAGVLRRESLGSTAIGNGIAIPHYSGAPVAELRSILGTATPAILWQHAEGAVPVHRVCLVVASRAMGVDAHLRMLEDVVRHARGLD